MKQLKAVIRKILRQSQAPIALTYRLSGGLLRGMYTEWGARHWSNLELGRWAALVKGDLVNVSGWTDLDKEGRRYRDYFPNRTSYTVSNIAGARGTALFDDGTLEIFLDLTTPLAAELKERYDVVLNHTVLEHIFPVQQAFRNLCELTRDLVIVVVPFSQIVHWEEGSYEDYWRFTPFSLRSMFRENGLEMIYLAHNDNPATDIYLLAVGSKRPEKWRDQLKAAGLLSNEGIPGTYLSNHRMP
jgi:hypothetical protein